jgi:hypothetical protein
MNLTENSKHKNKFYESNSNQFKVKNLLANKNTLHDKNVDSLLQNLV